LNAIVLRNGAEIANTPEVEALTGPLVAIVQRVADTLGGMGETLRRGEVIIAGSIVPAILLNTEDRHLSYTLDPLGTVSISFAAR
jgi:2-keto-4-pentenoate hydratase